MLRIVIGESWKLRPEYREGLRSIAEGRPVGFSPRSIIDCFHLEIDGVDVTRGALELPLLEGTQAFLHATHTVRDSAPRPINLPIPGVGAIRTARDCRSVILRILPSPFELEAGGYEVEEDAEHLCREIKRASLQLYSAFLDLHPELSRHRIFRRYFEGIHLQRGLGRAHSAPAPNWLRHAELGGGSLALTARDVLQLIDAKGNVRWTGGPRERVLDALRRVLQEETEADFDSQIRLHRASDTVTLGRSPPFPRAQLVEALRALEPDFDVRIPQSSSVEASSFEGPLRSIPASQIASPSADRLPFRGLRRVALRRKWALPFEATAMAIEAVDGSVVLRSPSSVHVLSATGEVRWSARMTSPLVVRESPERGSILGTLSDREIQVRALENGGVVSTVRVGHVGRLRNAFSLEGGVIIAHDETCLLAISPSGDLLWTRTLGRDAHVDTTGLGLVTHHNSGALEALSESGATLWRRTSLIRSAETLEVDRTSGIVLLAGRDEAGFHAIDVVALNHGSSILSHRVPAGWVTPPRTSNGCFLLAQPRKENVSLTAIRSSTGDVLFEERLPFASGAIIQPVGNDILAGGRGGEWVRLSRSGAVLAHHPPKDPDPALSPRHPKVMLAYDRITVTAGTHLHFADASTGRPLASVELDEWTLLGACALEGPLVVTLCNSGVIEAWESRGHLGVVPDEEL